MNTNILKTRYEMKRQKLAHEGIFSFFSKFKKNQEDERRLIKIKTIKLRIYWVHFLSLKKAIKT